MKGWFSNGMNRITRLQTFLIIAIAFLIGVYVGTNKVSLDWKNYKPSLKVISKEPPASISTVNFQSFWQVWQKLEGSYYDKTKLDPQKMLNGAISGMVESLDDPFTVYLPPTQNNDFKQGLAGQFQGIGAELGTKDKRIIVIAPLNGSPAQKAGVRAGDIILKVDGQSTESWNLPKAVEEIRGPKGSSVVLNILHKDEKAPRDIKITRDVITIKSVDGYVKKIKDIDEIKIPPQIAEKRVVYISLSQFGDNTNQEWLSLVNKLNLEQKKLGAEGLIFDLRNNPGGYLSDASFIASEFLEMGQSVVIQDKANGEQNTLKANRRGLFTSMPMIVLINKGSASASEIVAASLRDHSRAKLLGETSFGKGTIQEATDLGDGAGLHITIAKWLTPNGDWVNGSGLKPDIEVEFDTKDVAHDAQLERAIVELVK